MAGYNDTRNLIIEALMGRQAGTEIQPEKHQAYALNMLDYVRSVELVSSSSLVGLAEESTIPVQPNKGKVCYIAGVGQDRTVTFSNFIDNEGNPITITTGEMEGVFVILLWNMEHWVAYTFNTNIISSAESANFYYGYNIRKTYESVVAMNADSVNPIGTDGRLIKIGELVTVVNSTTPAENGYYSYEGSENGWLLQSGFSFEVVQTTGTDINKAMSQKAVTDELALKIDKTAVSLYNITNEIPLGAGSFYTLSTAITATPVANRKKGLLLTFESSAGVWETYQFKGVIANWSVLGSWSNDLSLKIDKTAIKQALGTSETDVMSQKAITEAIEFNSSGISIVGDDDNLIIKRVVMQSLPIGMSLRIYVKYPEVDYTGVTHSNSGQDRFAITARNNEGENIEVLVRLGMNNRTPLANYYDITIPEGTYHLQINMRASKGFEQQLWVSGTSLVNDLTTGGDNNPLTAEQGKILGALSSKVSLIGDNNTYLSSNIIKGIKPNHIYQISLNPDIDIEGVTVWGNHYDLFACILYDNKLENYIVAHKKDVLQTLEGDFTIKVPEGYSGGIGFKMRATKGAEQIIVITDITEENNFRLDLGLVRLDLGLPFELMYDDLNLYSNGLQYSLGANLGIGLKVSELPTNNDANLKTISIDLPENIAWLEVLNHYYTGSSYGSVIVDENDTVLNILVNRDHNGDSMSVIVPNNAKKLLLTVTNTKPTIICHPKNEYNIEGDEENKDISTFLIVSSLQSEGYNFNNPIMGGSVYNGMVSLNNKSAYIYLVPIPNGFKTLRCTHFRTSSNYGSAFVDENLNIVGSLVIKTYAQEEERISDVISIPNGAKFLYYVWYKNLNDLGFNPYVQLSKNAIAIDYSSNVNSWMNSDIINGNVIASTKSVLLPVISMDKGFHITLNDGYEFKSAHLYYNDNLICTDFYLNPYGGDGSVMSPFEYFDYKVFSVNQILPQFGVRLVVVKSDGSDISTDELIIKEKAIIDYREFTRITEDSIPLDKIHIIRKRINQFLNLVWKAEEDIYPANPGDYSLTHFKKGNTYISVPYSESAEFSKYIGWCVSFRTFLSACMNKRSVMYTERISATNRKSSYGITYNGLGSYYSNPYYGNVCTGLTQYALDLPNLYISGQYHSGGVPNLSKIDGATSEDVKLFDYLWNQGHCSIISDILLDENGDRKFIVWAEQTFPVTRNTVYTLDEFDKRCLDKSIEVWRNSKWDSIEEPEATPYIQSNKYEWQTPIVEDEDFHLFCGNYAAFAKGDPIFFNANREKGYTQLEVYAESDDSESNLLSTTDLTSLDNDGLYPEDGGDWVKIDFTNNNLQFGKYKARIISDEIQSKFVYFEIVEISLNAIIGETDTDVTYSCSSNGTPKMIRRESITGMYSGFKILEEQGQNLIVNWIDYSAYSYIKLYVKCDYGMVVKRVKMVDE